MYQVMCHQYPDPSDAQAQNQFCPSWYKGSVSLQLNLCQYGN